eukprot:TRINITY_DN7175_c0_g1_i3.p1 TRINITY_DN7175_c0_g1~~TRINITY_DN7175_c0_g1_i3.p1  ORF type:complete len:645 (-),score=148.19 TRINITY_DN7175_c0_g1_i3:194-2128(-)
MPRQTLLNKAGTLGDEMDKKRREQAEARQRREDARNKRMALAGNEIEDDNVLEQGVRGGVDRLHGQCGVVYDAVKLRIEMFLSPFRREQDYMAARYGGGIGIYFTILSNMFVTAMVVFITWVPFWITHFVSGHDSIDPMASGSSLQASQTLTSSFPTSEAEHLIVVFMISILILWTSAIVRFLRDDRAAYSIGFFEEQENQDDDMSLIQLRMVREALNPWVFSVEDAGENFDQQSNLANKMRSLLSEMERCRERESRTPEQKRKLTLRRVGGVFFNFVLICVQWSAIIILTIFTTTIQEAAADVGSVIAGIIVPASVSAINAALPLATSYITEFEAWDSKATHLKIEAGRLYVSRMFNVLILLLSYYQLLTEDTIYSGTEAVSDSGSWGNCYEDQVGNLILLLVISDFLIPKFVTFMSAWGKNVLARREAGVPWFSGKFHKQQFDLASELIQLMYSQTLAWILMPYYSFSVLFLPIMHFLSFKYFKWVIVKFHEKPVGMDLGDTARLMSFMWVVTLLIASISFAQFLSAPYVRYSPCSPFIGSAATTSTGTTIAASDTLWNLFGADNDGEFFLFISNRYVYAFIILACFIAIGHNRNVSTALGTYNDHKNLGYQARISELEKENRRMRHQKRMAEYVNAHGTER